MEKKQWNKINKQVEPSLLLGDCTYIVELWDVSLQEQVQAVHKLPVLPLLCWIQIRSTPKFWGNTDENNDENHRKVIIPPIPQPQKSIMRDSFAHIYNVWCLKHVAHIQGQFVKRKPFIRDSAVTYSRNPHCSTNCHISFHWYIGTGRKGLHPLSQRQVFSSKIKAVIFTVAVVADLKKKSLYDNKCLHIELNLIFNSTNQFETDRYFQQAV